MPDQPDPLTALTNHRERQARKRTADGLDNTTTQPIPVVPAVAGRRNWRPRTTTTRHRRGAWAAAALLTAATTGLLIGSPLLHAAGQQLHKLTSSHATSSANNPNTSTSSVDQDLLTAHGQTQTTGPDTTAATPEEPAAPGPAVGPTARAPHPGQARPPGPGRRQDRHPRPGPPAAQPPAPAHRAAAAPGPGQAAPDKPRPR